MSFTCRLRVVYVSFTSRLRVLVGKGSAKSGHKGDRKCIAFPPLPKNQQNYRGPRHRESRTQIGESRTQIGESRTQIGESRTPESIEEAQMRMAKALGITEYDAVTKDLARASYVVPRSYILYEDREGLFSERLFRAGNEAMILFSERLFRAGNEAMIALPAYNAGEMDGAINLRGG